MKELSLHILDIVENSVRAGASRVRIRIEESQKTDTLTIEVEDNGRGLDSQEVERILDPFYTTKPGKRVGIGLSLFLEAARRCGGTLKIDSCPGKGMKISADFGLNHVDRQPLGDIAGSMVMLVVGNPDVAFAYEHRRNGRVFVWSTDLIPRQSAATPGTAPGWIEKIQSDFQQGLKHLGLKDI